MHDLLAELIERGRSTGGLKGPLNIGRFDLAPRERSGGSGTGSREPQGGGNPGKEAWRVWGGAKKKAEPNRRWGVGGKNAGAQEGSTRRQARAGSAGNA